VFSILNVMQSSSQLWDGAVLRLTGSGKGLCKGALVQCSEAKFFESVQKAETDFASDHMLKTLRHRDYIEVSVIEAVQRLPRLELDRVVYAERCAEIKVVRHAKTGSRLCK
jgi:hypothetical protein